MRFVTLDDADAARRLRDSVSSLADEHPEFSAINVLTSGQRNGFIVLIVAIVLGLVFATVATGILIVASATVFYAAGIVNRAVLFWRSQDSEHVDVVPDKEARSIRDEDLPSYTVLVPAYREPGVIGALLSNLGRIDYPRDRLDVKVLLEEDDEETIEAIRSHEIGDFVEVIIVPHADPQTKPKALNYGLSLARGEIVTIFDAEDRPDPLQLRRAAIALSRAGEDVACLQAKLSYENVNQNLITKWFTLEYAMWFSQLLPGLAAINAPVPLGGTSNHFRRSSLETVGGWDPYNVTEDADLGIRLHRQGYSVRLLQSVTLEEANSDFVNWVKQRSRWYKGYLQTFLLHLREPRRLVREIGWSSFAQLVLFVGATPILALINPLFWAMTVVWFIGHPHIIKSIFPAPVFYLGITCWALGNFAITYLTLVTVRIEKRYELLWAALLVPIYWVMMSVAAVKAALQLVINPSFWEKTVHGLADHDRTPEQVSLRPHAAGR